MPSRQAGALVLLRISAEPTSDQPPSPGRALEVRDLRISVGTRMTGFASGLLRDIPIMRIEAAINQAAHRRHLLARVLDAGHLPRNRRAEPGTASARPGPRPSSGRR